MMRGFWITLAALMTMVSTAAAITWNTRATSPDPYAEDATCQTPRPNSYGSYIYQWPSRYDGVYWPYIDPHWIWRCPTSGYMSFGSDFEPHSDEERARVAEFLASSPAAESQLDRLEGIYQARGMPDAFWSHFYRLRAHLAPDTQTGDAYRARAAPLLEAQLADPTLAGIDRIQALYLLGFYARRLGDHESSAEHFAAARAVEWLDDEGVVRMGSPYFEDMIAAVERGELDGDLPQ